MGQRLLEINADMLIKILSEMSGVRPRDFTVVEDPIPEGVKVLSVRQSPYRQDVVEIELEHPDWSESEPRTRIEPKFMMLCSDRSEGFIYIHPDSAEVERIKKEFEKSFQGQSCQTLIYKSS
ncbi:MAG: hypothetical protein KGL39_00225 [Patescibacteria group bacterium]|nr:hypothetical protein [Patescibacteria group bacterium]